MTKRKIEAASPLSMGNPPECVNGNALMSMSAIAGRVEAR
jgi:hypothetical protein